MQLMVKPTMLKPMMVRPMMARPMMARPMTQMNRLTLTMLTHGHHTIHMCHMHLIFNSKNKLIHGEPLLMLHTHLSINSKIMPTHGELMLHNTSQSTSTFPTIHTFLNTTSTKMRNQRPMTRKLLMRSLPKWI